MKNHRGNNGICFIIDFAHVSTQQSIAEYEQQILEIQCKY